MKTRTAAAIRHVAFEDLGSFAPVLEAAGYTVRYLEAADGLASPAVAEEADLLVVLGGPIGAYEDDAYPFLADELRLLERRLAAGRPLLGICLGAQLIARALGASVYPGAVKEIGWSPVRLTDAGESSCLRHLGRGISVLHWHGDTFDLPAGATRLRAPPGSPRTRLTRTRRSPAATRSWRCSSTWRWSRRGWSAGSSATPPRSPPPPASMFRACAATAGSTAHRLPRRRRKCLPNGWTGGKPELPVAGIPPRPRPTFGRRDPCPTWPALPCAC